MSTDSDNAHRLVAENAELRARLEEAEDALRAIREGDVDALVVEGAAGPQIFTLQGLDAESNRFRGDILAQISDAVVAVDEAGFVTYFNAAAERRYGISISDALGNPLSTLWKDHWLRPEDAASSIAVLNKTGSWRGENVHITRDGSEIHVESAVIQLRDANGTPIGALATIRDITERKRAEQALRAGEDRLRLATEAAALGIWMWQPDEDRVVWENDWPYEVLGLPKSAEPVTAARFRSEFLHPDDLAAFEQAAADAVKTGGRFFFEGRFYRPNRELRWVELTGIPLLPAGGERPRVLGTVRDITEAKHAEATLRQNAGLFSTLIDQAPLGVYVVDAQFRLQQVNPLALPAFDNVRPLIGRDFGEVMEVLWGPELGKEIVAIFRHTLQTGERYISPAFSHERADLREQRAYDWEAQRVTLPDGQHGVVCYFTDVTERRQFELELQQAKAAAEAANRSKDRFLAVLSHELRTPLTPVLMVVGALEHDFDLRPDVRDDIMMIKRNIELEVKLIDDLLDLNRIISGKLALRIEAVDLNEIVRQVCEMCGSQLRERGIQLEVDLDQTVGTVNGDSTRLQQVLWNLLKNAIKFTPEKGAIRVTTKPLVGGRCEVRMRDNGIGIPSEALHRIFDPFEQGPAHITRQYGGLGLGLAICKSIAELHRGSIRVESDGLNLGSTFIAEFPSASAAAATVPENPAATENATPTQIRLLVVEDHAETARSLSRLLQRAGFAVIMTSDVASAAAAAETEPFDLLVTDLGLPDGTGFEVLRRVRAHRIVPAIAMSGYGMEEDIDRSREAGFIEHLVKPIGMPQLVAAIRRVTQDRD